MRSVTIGSCPAARSSAQSALVRRSCQTIARPSGSPVARSQTSVVSRWLVMPIAAIAPGPSPARSIAARQTAAVEDQMSAGSCSTQPDCGKCCGNSSCAVATTAMRSSKTMARLEVVPWSMARMWVIARPPVVLGRDVRPRGRGLSRPRP